ncbi:MAG: hypothetical protein LBD02_00705 [Christensenellaceae bacterium]|nr:hypothetical protein [Christensenellaceae bacterium]
MKNRRIVEAWNKTDPSIEAERRMLDGILADAHRINAANRKEDFMQKQPVYKYRPHRRFAAVVIAALLMLALAGTAFAIYRFCMKDLAGPTSQIGAEEVRTLSLNGLKGSPEYEAAQEWEAHIHAWYAAGENLAAPDLVPDAYSEYNAFSREAKGTLDGILQKYGLKMHAAPVDLSSLDALYSALGVSGFMPAAGSNGEYPVSGRLYEDATFSFNSAAALPSGVDLRYQFYRFAKGSLTRTGFLIADADALDEWTYPTAGGVNVLLAIGANKSILAADLDNGFVFINVLAGTENGNINANSFGAKAITKADLEAFADSFGFPVIDSLAK